MSASSEFPKDSPFSDPLACQVKQKKQLGRVLTSSSIEQSACHLHHASRLSPTHSWSRMWFSPTLKSKIHKVAWRFFPPHLVRVQDHDPVRGEGLDRHFVSLAKWETLSKCHGFPYVPVDLTRNMLRQAWLLQKSIVFPHDRASKTDQARDK